ncbi:Bromodomain containing protein [Tritrichomonas foetus]|uniref:Bromodomain containing protein n=1 Tax=Tritrichomonas foetus TaxID=1144522 RepID=A0A1J4JV07_9EUKA|nr:Bromodomain containing protein [Tritrichomonas foetus]|eukprot:OHT02977.1 Bromodomain containing protein [Tritrichomonas foetus]
MNSSQYRRCLEITKKLQKHPAAKPFLKPVNPSDPGMDQYFNVIDDPQDLTSIEERLKAKQYRSVREWKRDINTIWSNCASFNGISSYAYVLASHMSKIFEKELKCMSTTSIAGWLNKVNELKFEFCSKVENPPESIRESAPLEMLERKSLMPLFPEDYKSIFMGLTTFPNQSDRNELEKIVGKPESEVDLTKLSLSTLHKALYLVKSKTPEARKSLFHIKEDEIIA